MSGKVISLFRSKPAPTALTPGAQLAMPLFATTGAAPTSAVVSAWGALFPKQPELLVEREEKGGAVVHYGAGEASLTAIYVPMPVPNGEAVRAVKSSWMWREPDDPVRSHVAHAIVTAAPRAATRDVAWNVARLSAAILKAGSGVALYWGNGRQVHTPGLVERLASSNDTPPVPLWVNVTISGREPAGPFSAATHGLAYFGHRELEVCAARTPRALLRTTLIDVAMYLLREGPVLKHGETFGPTPDTKWSVHYEGSTLVPGRDVIVLGIP